MKTSRRFNRASGSTRRRIEHHARRHHARMAAGFAFLGQYERQVARVR